MLLLASTGTDPEDTLLVPRTSARIGSASIATQILDRPQVPIAVASATVTPSGLLNPHQSQLVHLAAP